MTKTLLSVEEDRDMWKRLFEDCNKKQGKEIERLMREYKERSKRLVLTTAVEGTIPLRDVPRGQSPMELLTPRELSRTLEVQIPTAAGRITIPNPSDTLVIQSWSGLCRSLKKQLDDWWPDKTTN